MGWEVSLPLHAGIHISPRQTSPSDTTGYHQQEGGTHPTGGGGEGGICREKNYGHQKSMEQNLLHMTTLTYKLSDRLFMRLRFVLRLSIPLETSLWSHRRRFTSGNFPLSRFIIVRKRSCRKLMFLHLSVILSMGGGECLSQCMLGYPQSRQTPPWAHTPPPHTHAQDGHCSGRYASYLNAFL